MENMFGEIMIWVCFVVLLCWMVVKLVYPLWWKPKRLTECLKREGVYGPPYKLLFGNTMEIVSMIMQAWSKPMELSHDIAHRVNPFIHQTVKTYGNISVIWYGNVPRVIVTSPELVKEILSNKFGHLEKPIQPPIGRLLAVGVANYEGEKWVRHRRILNPAFHLEKLKDMFPAFSSSCNKMIRRWEKQLVGTDGSCELDVWVELRNLTADVISRTAFGSNYEEGKRIFEFQEELAKLVVQGVRRIYIPGFRFLPTKANIRRKQLCEGVRSMLMDLIKKRMKEMEMGNSGKNDLLGIMLESNVSITDSKEDGRSNKTGMSLDEITEECQLFYFAGQETTSVLLTWTMVVLSMHPMWQKRARDEVLQVCGKDMPAFVHLNQLKIVTMILHEVLRLYPPIAIMFRHTCKTMTLGQLTLPAGVQILIPTLLIHHDPEIWGDDSEDFNPERFSGGVSNASKHPGAFFPFGWGPRICMGQTFAMIEAKLALSSILQHFCFELSPSYVHAPHTVVTLQPQHGAQLILRPLGDRHYQDGE